MATPDDDLVWRVLRPVGRWVRRWPVASGALVLLAVLWIAAGALLPVLLPVVATGGALLGLEKRREEQDARADGGLVV